MNNGTTTNNRHTTVDRTETDYFKQYQVNTRMGALSVTLLNKLEDVFTLTLRRFPDCCIFYCCLRIPSHFNCDTLALLNTWFYRFVNGKKKEQMNMVWAKEYLSNGMTSFKVALVFSAEQYRHTASPGQVSIAYKQRIRTSWAYALRTHEGSMNTLCIFPENALTNLKAGQMDYLNKVHKSFYKLSSLAKAPSYPVTDFSCVFGSKFSQSPKKTTAKRIKDTSSSQRDPW